MLSPKYPHLFKLFSVLSVSVNRWHPVVSFCFFLANVNPWAAMNWRHLLRYLLYILGATYLVYLLRRWLRASTARQLPPSRVDSYIQIAFPPPNDEASEYTSQRVLRLAQPPSKVVCATRGVRGLVSGGLPLVLEHKHEYVDLL